MLNVFLQAFHAATYAVVVNAGIAAYKSSKNWFFLVICITFLFQGERILRKIFSLGNSSGTLKDLGETGIAIWGISKAFANKTHRRDKKKDDDEDEDEEENESEEEGNDDTDNEELPVVPALPGSNTNPNSGQDMQPIRSPNGFRQTRDVSAAQDVVNKEAGKVRDRRSMKIISGITERVAGGVGSVMGLTYGLAANSSPTETAAWTMGGWQIGKSTGKTFVSKPITGISNAFAGRRYKKKVLRGDYDQQFKDAGLDLSAMDEKTAELERHALAQQISAAIRRGETVGEYKFQKTITKNK